MINKNNGPVLWTCFSEANKLSADMLPSIKK